jgi:hypothetical protein
LTRARPRAAAAFRRRTSAASKLAVGLAQYSPGRADGAAAGDPPPRTSKAAGHSPANGRPSSLPTQTFTRAQRMSEGSTSAKAATRSNG